MPSQLPLFTTLVPAAGQRWNDVRLPDEYAEYFESHKRCLNCRQVLRHPLHALNHFKKYHMVPKNRFFLIRYGACYEVTLPVYLKAKAKNFATARTK